MRVCRETFIEFMRGLRCQVVYDGRGAGFRIYDGKGYCGRSGFNGDGVQFFDLEPDLAGRLFQRLTKSQNQIQLEAYIAERKKFGS